MYALDLRTYFAWCAQRGTEVFAMTRPHLELYVRGIQEDRGYAPATTARWLSTVAGFPLRDVQIAARHADPRTTTRYERARGNLDRHADYVVAAFIAGAA